MNTNRYGCYLRFRANQSITGVTICIFVAFSQEAAYAFFGDRPQRKNSGWYVRQQVTRQVTEEEDSPLFLGVLN